MAPIKSVHGTCRKSRGRSSWCAVLLLAVLGALAPAHAHEVRPAVVTLTFDAAARFDIEIAANLEAMLAGIAPEHRDTNESPNAKRYDALRALAPNALHAEAERVLPGLLEELRLEFDGAAVRPELSAVEIPPVGDPAVSRISRLRLKGQVPPGARAFRWSYPERFGANVLRVQRAQDREAFAVWLPAGAASAALRLQGDIAATRGALAVDYVVLGFTHILPKGLDHILFVLGLFLLSTRAKALLLQVTAFTVAHSITLALAIAGVVSLAPAIVEPLIAASIVYVAIENLFTATLHAWRPFVVFGFGLLHGLGFAGVLQEVGLPRAEFWTGLIAFNVGVELGQLAVIALAFVLVGVWSRRRSWYRARIVVPASLAIAAVGLYWTVERLAG